MRYSRKFDQANTVSRLLWADLEFRCTPYGADDILVVSTYVSSQSGNATHVFLAFWSVGLMFAIELVVCRQ